MNAPVLTFFNNKAGVGKTSLVYHLAWMFSDLGKRVLAIDLDPQANLTSAFIEEDRLETLICAPGNASTVSSCLQPVLEGSGTILQPALEHLTDTLSLIAGDLSLSSYEQELSQEWPKCLDRNPRAFLVTAAFWQLMQRGAREINADIILADVGPNLGAINRAAMVATDYVVVPLSPDLFSLQGLEHVGPTLRDWRENWLQRLERAPDQVKPLPHGGMRPIGYIVLQQSVRLDRPVSAYEKWIYRIPQEYHQAVLADDCLPPSIETDAENIAQLKHYRSLMPMAQEARKPIFHLKPADGAIGSHMAAVQNVRSDFEALARNIARRIGLPL